MSLKLFPLPKARATTIAVVPDIKNALSLLNHAQSETGGAVEAFELIPDVFLELVKKFAPQYVIPFEKIPELCVLIEISETSDNKGSINNSNMSPLNSRIRT